MQLSSLTTPAGVLPAPQPLTCLFSPDGRLLWVSQSWTDGDPQREAKVLGLGWRGLVHADDLPRVLAWIADPELTIAIGPDSAISFRARRLNGDLVTVYYAKTAHPRGWMVVCATVPFPRVELPAPPCIACLCLALIGLGRVTELVAVA